MRGKLGSSVSYSYVEEKQKHIGLGTVSQTAQLKGCYGPPDKKGWLYRRYEWPMSVLAY